MSSRSNKPSTLATAHLEPKLRQNEEIVKGANLIPTIYDCVISCKETALNAVMDAINKGAIMKKSNTSTNTRKKKVQKNHTVTTLKWRVMLLKRSVLQMNLHKLN